MNDWPSKKLGDLTTVISSGATPLGGSENYSTSGDVMFIRSQNVLMNQLFLANVAYVSADIDRQLARTRVEHGDVLLNITGASIGRVAVFDLPNVRANVNQHVCVIRTTPTQICPLFLSRYLATPIFQAHINRIQAGGTRQALNFTQIADFDIPVPPLEEQRRIAVILDKADGLRQKRRLALQKLDSLTQSIFLTVFGDPVSNPKRWPTARMSDVLDRIESGTSPVCLDRQAGSDEWGVLKLGAVTWCEFDQLEQKALPPESMPRAELEVKPGDLLFTRKNTRDLVAACALVYETRERLMLPDLIFRLVLNSDAPVTKEYLHQLLIYPPKRTTIQNLAGGSAGSMPNISKSKLLEVRIELPPLDLQRQFSRMAEKVRKMKHTMTEASKHDDSVFDSLQHLAFRNGL